MEPADNIIVVAMDKEGKEHNIEFLSKINNFEGIFKTMKNDVVDGKINFMDSIKEPHLYNKLKQFMEAHNYDEKSIRIDKPMKSSEYKSNVDEKTYEVLKEYEKEENEEEAVKMIGFAEFMQIPQFKDAVYYAVASKFYIGSTEDELEKFREKHGLHELSVDEEDAIIREYPEIFNKLKERFQEELRKLEKELPQN